MLPIIGTVLVLGCWQLVCSVGLVPSTAVASPWTTAQALGRLAGDHEFWHALGDTVAVWWTGLAIAVLIAVPVGVALGSSEVSYRSTRVLIDFFRTVPPVALLPVALLLGGATSTTAVALAALGVVWPLAVQATDGVHQLTPQARDVGAVYCLRRRDVFAFLTFPGALPFIVTGVRVAATLSLLVVIGSGVIADTPGLGREIAAAQNRTQSDQVFALVVVCGLLGVVANSVTSRWDRRVMSRRQRVGGSGA